MGTKERPGAFDCYEAAEPDEPMFVLLARDPLAPELVRTWAARRYVEAARRAHEMTLDELVRETHKTEEAWDCADAMEDWRAARREP